jgi:hypothetical protein
MRIKIEDLFTHWNLNKNNKIIVLKFQNFHMHLYKILYLNFYIAQVQIDLITPLGNSMLLCYIDWTIFVIRPASHS